MTAALVTDAESRSVVWFVRGLVAAGIPTVAVSPAPLAAGRWARGLSGRATVPDPRLDPARFRAALERAAEPFGGAVVYPGQEETIDVLLAERPDPERVRLPFPDEVLLVRDKERLAQGAEGAGLRPPVTWHAGPAHDLDPGSLAYPAVVKPLAKGTALDRAHVVAGEGALRRVLAPLPPHELIIVQEHVRGPLLALSLVLDRAGRAVACAQQVARRTWPADAGPSRVAVSVAPDAELVERGRRLLAGLGYWGLAELQLLDSPGGPRLIDVNPRPYGSIALAIAAGVNLPAFWHAVASGAALPPEPPFRAGVTYRWLEAELHAALHGEARSLLRRAPAPRVGAFWSRRDPVPAALLTAQAGRAWLGQARRRVGRGSP